MNKGDGIPLFAKEAFLAISVFAICNLTTQLLIGTFFDNSLIYSIPITIFLILFYKKGIEL